MPRLVFLALTLIGAASLRAQCPNGTPPPCGAPTASASRRVDPALDDATWIVLPFNNLSKSPDIEWLRDASVNLLYLDLSRWSDIKVVDDERVADLLRVFPETRDGKPVSLATGLAIAKRVGAGRLVMGDLLKVGPRTTVTAKVFEVRGGQRLRTSNQGSVVQDSLIGSFGALARGILNVAPTSPIAGAIGTTSTAAYRDYIAGVAALNRFDLTPARAHFLQALTHDSAFALAHYKLAVLIGWETPDDDAKLAHARLALRYSSTLPPREKTLMAALVAFDGQEYGRACEAYGSLVRADSNDVEALYGMGECLWHDNLVEAVGGDSTRLRFRGSWNAALRMFQRTLAVDPSYHLAFQHILDTYLADGRSGCRPKDAGALRAADGNACAASYVTAIRRDGDSLLLAPVNVRSPAGLTNDAAEARRTDARGRNLRQGRDVATAWTDAAPDEARAFAALARVHALLGELEAADAAFARVRMRDLNDTERGRVIVARAEQALKLGRETEFVRIVDSMSATRPTGNVAAFVAFARAAQGRMSALDSLITIQLQRSMVPPGIVPYFRFGPRVLLGGSTDSAMAAERVMFDLVMAAPGAPGRRYATTQIAGTLTFGLRAPRATWPALDSVPDARIMPALALSRNDTSALRAAAKVLDSASRASIDASMLDDGSSFVAVEAYLALGDSAAALSMMRLMFDRGIRPVSLFSRVGSGYIFPVFLWPRTLLLRADLEASHGDKAVARRYYRRFITLWTGADPEFQPVLDRARKSLAALGPG